MKIFISLLVLLVLISCTTKSEKVVVDYNNEDEMKYLFQNPCWGISNLEKMYLKWNWVKISKKSDDLNDPMYIEFRMIRKNKYNEVVFNELLYRTRSTKIPLMKKYHLYSPYYTKDIYVKTLKKLLMRDRPFFEKVELDEYSMEEWEEKSELEGMYSGSKKNKFKESFMVSNKKMGKKGCNTSFIEKSTHKIRVTLFDKENQEIITTEVPLNKIERTPPYFSKYELPKLGLMMKGDVHPISVSVSVVLERF